MPDCPKCGNEMVLRRARKGPNAGNQFWGCSDFPNCRGTLDFREAPASSSGEKPIPSVTKFDTESQNLTTTHFVPRNLGVKAHHKNSLVEIFDSRGSLFSALNDEAEINSNNWGWEYSSAMSERGSDGSPSFLATIFKHFTRGRRILLPPRLEAQIIASKGAWNKALRETGINTFNPDAFEFDSEEEREFAKLKLGNLPYTAALCPQINLAGLVGNSDFNQQRVDFAIATEGGFRVVEIDGSQHRGRKQADIDQERDAALSLAGITVTRIPASEATEADWFQLPPPPELISTPEHIAHAIFIGLYLGLRSGVLPFDGSGWHVCMCDLGSTKGSKKTLETFCKKVVGAFLSYLSHLARIHKVEASLPENVSIELDGGDKISVLSVKSGEASQSSAVFALHFGEIPAGPLKSGHLYYRELPFSYRCYYRVPCPPSGPLKADPESCRFFLEYFFRHEEFRDGQLEGLKRALNGNDGLILLPTGHGKSVIYQLAGLLRPGVGIVVDPIISLMEDQIDNLGRVGIDRVAGVSSQIKDRSVKEQVVRDFSRGQYYLFFVAPERFQIPEFRESLRGLTAHTCVSVIAIDEAHCVSEWGHDFRTSYLNVGRNAREFCATGEQSPPLLGLTGTASRAVLKDVKRALDIMEFDALITPSTFDRPELNYWVVTCRSDEKFSRLEGIISAIPDKLKIGYQNFFHKNGAYRHSGLIFCPHVNGEFGIVHVSGEISKHLGLQTARYSGGAPKGQFTDDWDLQKRHFAKSFKDNAVPLMVATKAFGMGIDKPNVRFTVHYSIPHSIESFYQEAGRAGRDGARAVCVIIASNDRERENTRLLADTTGIEELRDEMQELDDDYESRDDISRALFFHTKAFQGVDEEIFRVEGVLGQIGNSKKQSKVTLKPNGLKLPELEKAVHRLVTIGLVSDYTLDHSHKRIDAYLSGADDEDMADALRNYVSAYQRSRAKGLEPQIRVAMTNNSRSARVLALVRVLLEFVYDTIELGRRRALLEVVQTCSSDASDESIRSRILSYLERSEFDEALEEIIDDINDSAAVMRLLDNIVSPQHAKELRGQLARQLESYPDHPSLLYLRGITEALCDDTDDDVVVSSMRSWASSSCKNYKISSEILLDIYIQSTPIIENSVPNLVLRICHEVFSEIHDPEFFSGLLRFSRSPAEVVLALEALVRIWTSDVENSSNLIRGVLK